MPTFFFSTFTYVLKVGNKNLCTIIFILLIVGVYMFERKVTNLSLGIAYFYVFNSRRSLRKNWIFFEGFIAIYSSIIDEKKFLLLNHATANVKLLALKRYVSRVLGWRNLIIFAPDEF